MKPIRAGEFRHVITVQRRDSSRNTGGDASSQGWADIGAIRASISHSQGGEEIQGEKVVATYTHVIRTRCGGSITNADQLKFGARLFAVVDINNVDELGRLYVIRAIEVTDA